MTKILYQERSYDCDEKSSVLETLIAQGVPVPSSCKAGICQTCLMRATKGNVPSAAQKGLKPTLVAQNYFLACSCYPTEDLAIVLPETGVGKLTATIMAIKPLNADIACVSITPSHPIEYKAGQFINLFKDELTARRYSLASIPTIDRCLDLHVRRIPRGKVSTWIHEILRPGDLIEISEALGDCFYVPGNPSQEMLLLGTGSGLAPLYGIIRDALGQGHSGQIRLYHGSLNVDGLYFIEELQLLAKQYTNFYYTPCLSGSDVPEGFLSGNVLDVAMKDVSKLTGWRVFLCGNPDMVTAAKKKVFLAGTSMRDIYADPFLIAPS